MFAQWVYGKNQQEKVMTGSYNETLSTTFSKAVRDGISRVKADEKKIVYSDIFPGVRIKRGDGAMTCGAWRVDITTTWRRLRLVRRPASGPLF